MQPSVKPGRLGLPCHGNTFVEDQRQKQPLPHPWNKDSAQASLCVWSRVSFARTFAFMNVSCTCVRVNMRNGCIVGDDSMSHRVEKITIIRRNVIGWYTWSSKGHFHGGDFLSPCLSTNLAFKDSITLWASTNLEKKDISGKTFKVLLKSRDATVSTNHLHLSWKRFSFTQVICETRCFCRSHFKRKSILFQSRTLVWTSCASTQPVSNNFSRWQDCFALLLWS